MWRSFIAAAFIVLLSGIRTAFATDFYVQTAPPAPSVEVVPEVRPGYVWAPAYWRWDGSNYSWVAGRMIEVHPGFHWVPDRWTEFRDSSGTRYHYDPGHWERG